MRLNRSLENPRFAAGLLALFAGVGLGLALIGVHGVLSYNITQRSSEIGIRIALGAPRTRVLRTVVGEGFRLATFGVALGGLGALGVSRLLESMVYGISSTDVGTYLVVGSSVLATATLASLIPGLRASRSDPLAALKGG